MDWFHFDVATSSGEDVSSGTSELHAAEVLPLPLRFAGMPASRFWEMGEGDVYFGGIDAAPEDLARIAVAAFGTIYADDWYLVPIGVRTGTLSRVTLVVVTDDFGEVTAVPSTAEADGAGRAFRFFELTGDDGLGENTPDERRAPMLFVPPTVETTNAGRPLEDVGFFRDEMADLAWAVEKRIESHTGRPVDLAAKARAGGPSAVSPIEVPEGHWRFELSSDVPGNWVPLVPVQLGPRGQVRLQRGRVPVPGGSGTRGARGTILESDQRLLLHEEEVPRAGARGHSTTPVREGSGRPSPE